MTDAQLESVVLYLADRSKDDPSWGRTKLCKLLFFADVDYYATHLRSLTGLEYHKRDHGPYPPTVTSLCARLVRDGRARQESVPVSDFTQNRLVALAPPQEGDLPAEITAVLDRVLTKFAKASASQLSEETHRMIAWKAAADREPIPLGATLLNAVRPTREDYEHALELTGEE